MTHKYGVLRSPFSLPLAFAAFWGHEKQRWGYDLQADDGFLEEATPKIARTVYKLASALAYDHWELSLPSTHQHKHERSCKLRFCLRLSVGGLALARNVQHKLSSIRTGARHLSMAPVGSLSFPQLVRV